MAATADRNGRTTTISSDSVMTAAASDRLPQRRAWTFSMSGQVETTMVVAQSIAARKRCSTQKLAAISMTMKSSARTVRVSPWACSVSGHRHSPFVA